MTSATHSDSTGRLPTISELTLRMMQSSPTSLDVLEDLSEVEPHETYGAVRIDPRSAWSDAIEALRAFGLPLHVRHLTAPPEWNRLVSLAEARATWLPMAAGNYPQRVGDLDALLHAASLSELRPLHPPHESGMAVATPIRNWVAQAMASESLPNLLLAAGVLRRLEAFTETERVLTFAQSLLDAAGSVAWANEKAALLWHRGRWEEAAHEWDKLPDSPVVHFNRGMSALFLGPTESARLWLARAGADLPESSSWHHLARLYLSLAEIRA